MMVPNWRRRKWRCLETDQRMRLECGIGFRQLRTCRRTRPGQLCAIPDNPKRTMRDIPLQSVHPPNGRWNPTAIRDLRLRRIEPQRQPELSALRRREPVRFLVGAGALVLDIKIK